mgnify:CR=1 FL=1
MKNIFITLQVTTLLCMLITIDGCVTLRNRNSNASDEDNFFVTGNSLLDITTNDRMEILKQYQEGDRIKEISYDTKSVVKYLNQDNTIGAWVQEYIETSKHVEMTFYLYRVNCVENKFRVLEKIEYSFSDHKWKSQFNSPYDKSEMQDIIPLSVAETIKEKLCNY